MNILSHTDLKVINKIIRTLKQSHGVHLEYQDPELATKICTMVVEKEDPNLTELWDSLSGQYRKESAVTN